ncbi:hypothetical protein DPMN_066810 [Dreissena polymorpha]|uniref:Uncharacterized protein n=1 Tax=Dreissena polymorpha TaxID=45954 RepID=A0A9D4BT35_DREPO|nr:hypothetical protein DPMN_066810 [Dreissena polymorpha]
MINIIITITITTSSPPSSPPSSHHHHHNQNRKICSNVVSTINEMQMHKEEFTLPKNAENS